MGKKQFGQYLFMLADERNSLLKFHGQSLFRNFNFPHIYMYVVCYISSKLEFLNHFFSMYMNHFLIVMNYKN